MSRVAYIGVIAAAAIAAWLWFGSTSTNESVYAGCTTSDWEAEIRCWTPFLGGASNKTGRWTIWAREVHWSEKWLSFVLPKRGPDKLPPDKLPLLEGDAEAVPVLIELLRSRDRQVRLIAAEGLERVGAKADAAIPALTNALSDADADVRAQAGQALYRIDRDAARRVGLEWTIWGLSYQDEALLFGSLFNGSRGKENGEGKNDAWLPRRARRPTWLLAETIKATSEPS